MTVLFTDTLIQVSAFLFDVHGGIDMDAKFVRDRITELRMLNNVSEYKLSLDLGRSHSYIQSISSGKTSPSMSVFFDICNYFDISPSEFFDKDIHNPFLKRRSEDILIKNNGFSARCFTPRSAP